jgi:UPF0716 protein FxsA
MYILYLPFLFLFAEIAGFVVIGGKVGLGLTILWLFGAGLLGSFLLHHNGFSTFKKVQISNEEELFTSQDLFDAICYFIAALLLIFPGFISDFIAIPFLIAPLRRWMMRYFQLNKPGFATTIVRESRQFRYTRQGDDSIIEGEYKKIEQNDENNP